MLVTGGKGFIGSHLVNYLKNKDHYVRSADIVTTSYLKTNEDEFMNLDLRIVDNCKKAVNNMDWVINLAAHMGGIGYITYVNAAIMRDSVLINTNMLEASKNENILRYLFSSSACVYPENLQMDAKVNPLKEGDAFPASPDTAYGWEKIFTEIMCESYQKDYGLSTRIARFHNIYGSYGHYEGGKEKAPAALCKKVSDAKNNDVITVWGDGYQTRSFLYITDCLNAVYKLIQSNYIFPLNIGSDKLVSADDLTNLIINISGKNLTIKHDLTRPQGVRGRNANIEKIKTILNWSPKVSLTEGLTHLYNWINKQ